MHNFALVIGNNGLMNFFIFNDHNFYICFSVNSQLFLFEGPSFQLVLDLIESVLCSLQVTWLQEMECSDHTSILWKQRESPSLIYFVFKLISSMHLLKFGTGLPLLVKLVVFMLKWDGLRAVIVINVLRVAPTLPLRFLRQRSHLI